MTSRKYTFYSENEKSKESEIYLEIWNRIEDTKLKACHVYSFVVNHNDVSNSKCGRTPTVGELNERKKREWIKYYNNVLKTNDWPLKYKIALMCLTSVDISKKSNGWV